MDIIAATTLFFLIMDPLGNMAIFMSALKNVPDEQKTKVLLRELLIALLILLVFMVCGENMLNLLHLEQGAVGISGGIILFLVALKMIFPPAKNAQGNNEPSIEDEPFIVPMATPLIAGPSILATMILMGNQYPDEKLSLAVALFAAWLVSAAILVCSGKIMKLIGMRGVLALERLMGMILIMISVQMLLDGIKDYI